jgi:hypothetical protein
MVAVMFMHRVMVYPEWVPSVLQRLNRAHGLGIDDFEFQHDPFSKKTAVTWHGPQHMDLDVLRPDILPPKETS